MPVDSAGHLFQDVDNVRVTYVPAADRKPELNWAGSDVVRLQSYKQGTTGALHMGAELPVASPDAFVALISVLCAVYNEGRRATHTITGVGDAYDAQ